jgi:hypothetical protein
LRRAELHIPKPDVAEEADRIGLRPGEHGQVFDGRVVPAVRVGRDRGGQVRSAINEDLGAGGAEAHIDASSGSDREPGAGDAIGALEEAQYPVAADVVAAQHAIGEHLD